MQSTLKKKQSPILKSTISVGQRGERRDYQGNMSCGDHTRSQPMQSVHARVPVCVHECARAQPRPPGPALGALLPRASSGRGRARGARSRRGGRAHPGPCAHACGAGSLCASVRPPPSAPFLLRSGQAHKREGGCGPSPSSFPQMPSAAGLLLQYGPRRLSPRPWLAAGLWSALAAFTVGAPPNRLLRLLICLKSNRTSRRRARQGRERPGRCARAGLGGGARAARPAAGSFVPQGPGGLGGGGSGRQGCGVPGRARWPLADGAPSHRFLPSKQSGPAAAAQWQQGWGAGAVPVPSELAHCSLAH